MASPASLEQCLFTLDAMPSHFRPEMVAPISFSYGSCFFVPACIPLKSRLPFMKLVLRLKRSPAEEGFILFNAFLDRHEGGSAQLKGRMARRFCLYVYRDDRMLIPGFFSIQARLYRWLLDDGRGSNMGNEELDWRILAVLIREASEKTASVIKLREEADRVTVTHLVDGWEDGGQLPRENLPSLSGVFLLATTFEEGQLAEFLALEVPWPYHAPSFTWEAPGTWLIRFPLQPASLRLTGLRPTPIQQ